jgi:hypothetical protein
MAKKSKLRDRFDAGDLNLLPILNLICLLIPFLLLAAQFVKIGIILVETPRRSRVPGTKVNTKPLNLTLVMTDRGFYLKSRHGSECPAGVSQDARLCFERREGKLTDPVLRKLQLRLWKLYADKYRDPGLYRTPAERHAITVVPEPTVSFDDIVRTLDVIREIPADAADPPVKHAVPAGGCATLWDKDSGRWTFETRNGVNVRDVACMYHRVTLALGSS